MGILDIIQEKIMKKKKKDLLIMERIWAARNPPFIFKKGTVFGSVEAGDSALEIFSEDLGLVLCRRRVRK